MTQLKIKKSINLFGYILALEITKITMARLCIRILPNINSNPQLNLLRIQVGDVVEIEEDSHQWSQAELNCGQYRFIDVIGVSPADLLYLVTPVIDAEGNMIKRRTVTLDASKLLTQNWKNLTSITKTQLDFITINK